MKTLRINELVVHGLRGCPQRFTLPLRGRSLCLVGENGHAKTTLADAAELWSTGDLSAFHREGCSLDTAIHLDASQAIVEITGDGFPPQRRILTNSGVGDLELLAPSSVTQPDAHPIPILRHGTITAFMSQSAGEKKKALLELLGLSDLNDVRGPLKTTSGHAKRDADAAHRQVAAERAALDLQLTGEDLVAYAEQRRVHAGLEQPIREAGDILSLHLSVSPIVPPDRAGAIDRLAAALAAVSEDPAPRWNSEVADEAAVRADGMAALLRTAQRVITPADRSCPVCEQPIVGEELAERLVERAASLEAIRSRLSEAAAELATLDAQFAAAADAISVVRHDAPATGWPDGDQLAAVEEALGEHRRALQVARAEHQACPPAPDLSSLRAVLPALRKAASDDSGAAQVRTLIELAELRQKCLRLADAQQYAAVADQAYAAVQRFLEIADEEIEQAITTAIKNVAALAANYYGKLIRGTPFSDIELVYKPTRSGQVEFSLTFDDRHSGVSPPQRIMSTSQLNALGLALHLARLKLDTQPWRTLLLDDVINGFDAPHRQGLARLLADEFSDWQVIALTHDRAFKEILRRTVKGWEFKEIIAFSPRGGPHLSDGDPRIALRERLDEGATAMELAHLARRALEQGLSTPLAKLNYEIRFDPDQRYGAFDYLKALRRGFKHSGSPLKDLPVLSRMEADGYMSNLGVHDRPDATALTTDDVYRLLDDLDELDSALRCSSCNEHVWKQHQSQSGSEFRCGCGALAA